jgi:CRP-like cAMP-binding protein
MNQLATRNRLLSALPPHEREMIEANSTLVPLNRRDVLYDAGRPLEHVYFIEDGIVSILSLVSDRTGVETATIGREGTVGMAAFHGVAAAPERAMVQVPGAAYRIDVSAFRELLPKMPALDSLLHRFAVVMFSLASQNSACNRKHSIEARCARWLLTVADRLDSATLELTHDFVAQMLGVRRASVTESLNSLEARGFVRTARGRITVVDRVGLEGVACSCYAMIAGVVGTLLDSNSDN